MAKFQIQCWDFECLQIALLNYGVCTVYSVNGYLCEHNQGDKTNKQVCSVSCLYTVQLNCYDLGDSS